MNTNIIIDQCFKIIEIPITDYVVINQYVDNECINFEFRHYLSNKNNSKKIFFKIIPDNKLVLCSVITYYNEKKLKSSTHYKYQFSFASYNSVVLTNLEIIRNNQSVYQRNF